MMNQSYSLPPALLLDSKSRLSEQSRTEILKLNGSQSSLFLLQSLSSWIVIITVITTAVYVNNIWVNLLAILIIATRFNIFALLIHEQVHFLGIRGKLWRFNCEFISWLSTFSH